MPHTTQSDKWRSLRGTGTRATLLIIQIIALFRRRHPHPVPAVHPPCTGRAPAVLRSCTGSAGYPPCTGRALAVSETFVDFYTNQLDLAAQICLTKIKFNIVCTNGLPQHSTIIALCRRRRQELKWHLFGQFYSGNRKDIWKQFGIHLQSQFCSQ